MTFWLVYLALGAFSGLIAGLLGVGGGIVIVPGLTALFAAQHLPPGHIVHIALGTSLTCILFTSFSSLRAHHGRGAVDWQVVRRIAPGIVCGTLGGSWLSSHLSSRFLSAFFAVFLFYVAAQMLFGLKPKGGGRELPGPAGMAGTGALIGGFSSLVGIGGGTLSIPFMVWCNVAFHRAIGTSAAIGFPIALAGTVGYLFTGLSAEALPPGCAGFIYLPALVGVSLASTLTAPLGARLAHSLPVVPLKRVFGCFVLIMAIRLAVKLL